MMHCANCGGAVVYLGESHHSLGAHDKGWRHTPLYPDSYMALVCNLDDMVPLTMAEPEFEQIQVV